MFADKPILIVEDEYLIAMDLASAVEDLDGMVVGPAFTVAEALELLGGRPVSAAVLDANLGRHAVTPVALQLRADNIPFVIHTGSGVPADLDALHPGLPVVMKPAPAVMVLVRLAT